MHDKAAASEFLATLGPSALKFTFQFFGDGDDQCPEILHGSLDDVWPKVQLLNTLERRVGVFVTVNETDFKGRRWTWSGPSASTQRARALTMFSRRPPVERTTSSQPQFPRR